MNGRLHPLSGSGVATQLKVGDLAQRFQGHRPSSNWKTDIEEKLGWRMGVVPLFVVVQVEEGRRSNPRLTFRRTRGEKYFCLGTRGPMVEYRRGTTL